MEQLNEEPRSINYTAKISHRNFLNCFNVTFFQNTCRFFFFSILFLGKIDFSNTIYFIPQKKIELYDKSVSFFFTN